MKNTGGGGYKMEVKRNLKETCFMFEFEKKDSDT